MGVAHEWWTQSLMTLMQFPPFNLNLYSIARLHSHNEVSEMRFVCSSAFLEKETTRLHVGTTEVPHGQMVRTWLVSLGCLYIFLQIVHCEDNFKLKKDSIIVLLMWTTQCTRGKYNTVQKDHVRYKLLLFDPDGPFVKGYNDGCHF